MIAAAKNMCNISNGMFIAVVGVFRVLITILRFEKVF